MHHSQVLIDVLNRACPNPAAGVEIGVQNGNTSAALLGAFPSLVLYMVDPWCVPNPGSAFMRSGDPTAKCTQDEWDAAYQKTLKQTAFAGGRAIVCRSVSSEAVDKFGDGTLDFCFIDGCHSCGEVLDDARRWWKKLREQGVLIFHDYGNTAAWTQGVAPAVDQFALSVQRDVNEEAMTVAWIQK